MRASTTPTTATGHVEQDRAAGRGRSNGATPGVDVAAIKREPRAVLDQLQRIIPGSFLISPV